MTVPANVQAAIKLSAAEQWPGDYTMQAHVIREQSEAFKKMAHYLTALDMSNEVFSICYRKAVGDWPSDYTMQVHVFEQQTQDAIAFFEYEDDRMPKNTLEEIKQSAFAEWQGDYTMMLHVLSEQTAAWLEIHGS